MVGWVTVSSFDNSLEAHIVKGLLESESIPVFLVGEHFSSAQYRFAFGLGEVSLQVPHALATKAKQTLLQYREGDFQKLLEEELALMPATCEYCGSNDVEEISARPSLILNVLTQAILLGLVMPPNKYKICKKCKNRISEH